MFLPVPELAQPCLERVELHLRLGKRRNGEDADARDACLRAHSEGREGRGDEEAAPPHTMTRSAPARRRAGSG